MDNATLTPGSYVKAAKKRKFKKEPSTYQFQLSLDTPKNSKTPYPDFNWLDLVAKEEEKKVEAKRKEVLDPFASDDEDQLKEIARKFEEKYGGASEKIREKKKVRKQDDYADLGYGYDSEDSFIDDSDKYDEIMPEDLEPKLGGFYINMGPLEFKPKTEGDDSDVEAILDENERKKPRIDFTSTSSTMSTSN